MPTSPQHRTPPPQHASPSSWASPTRRRQPAARRRRIWAGSQIHSTTASTHPRRAGAPPRARDGEEGRWEPPHGQGRRPGRRARTSSTSAAPAASWSLRREPPRPSAFGASGPPPPRTSPAAAAAGEQAGARLAAALGFRPGVALGDDTGAGEIPIPFLFPRFLSSFTAMVQFCCFIFGSFCLRNYMLSKDE